MSIINLQEHKIRRMADSHDSFRTAAALIDHETALAPLYRSKHHKPAQASERDKRFAMEAREAEQYRIITERIRKGGEA